MVVVNSTSRGVVKISCASLQNMTFPPLMREFRISSATYPEATTHDLHSHQI